MSWFSKPVCSHDYGNEQFQDLHTGGDGEIYVRSRVVCTKCGHSRWFAVRLPNVVTEVLHENLDVGTMTRKDTDMRRRVADALDVVYNNVDKGAIQAQVGFVIREEIKKAFNNN